MSDRYCMHNQLMNDFIDENFENIRTPFTAGFELTAKCNLNCVHCYAKPDRNHKDFSLDEFKSIFDVLVDRGLIDCYFTGGEIFTRPDFEDMFVYAKKKGVLVSLLSNITLLSQKHIDLFKEYPVEVISTSMYGYSEESYEKVTGVKGSYKKFMDALELLQKNDIKYELKFVAMEQNIGDLYKVREFGNKLGVPMVIILDVHPMSDGSMEPVSFRLTPEKAFDFDVKDEGRNCFWKDDDFLKNLIIMANQGDVEAMVMVGDCYLKGLHTAQNDIEAHRYYKMAADTGNLEASLMVGIEFYNGIGTSVNKKLSVKYLQIAADGGIPYAQFLLATIYELNKDMEDRQKALKYFQMASKKGHAKSQIELATLMIVSEKTQYSLENALFWLVCAYLHDSDEKNKEERQDALKKINVLIEGGLSGGKQTVLKVIDMVKDKYPQYLTDPF